METTREYTVNPGFIAGFHGSWLDRATLQRTLAEADQGHAPRAASLQEAILWAMEQVAMASNDRQYTHRVVALRGTPGYTILRIEVGDVHAEGESVFSVQAFGSGAYVLMDEREWEPRFRAQFDVARDMVPSSVLRAWIQEQVVNHGGVQVLGGPYWMASKQSDWWTVFMGAVRQAGGKVGRLSMQPDPETVEQLAAELAKNVVDQAEKMAEELPTLSKRGVTNRQWQAKELAKKLAEYEQDLGQRLDAAREALATLETAVVVAVALTEAT